MFQSRLNLRRWITLLSLLLLTCGSTRLARAQVATFGFEFDGTACGGEVFGAPGEVIEVEGFVTVDFPEGELGTFAIGISGEGAGVQFTETAFTGCDAVCAGEQIGLPVFFFSAEAVDPARTPSGGPLDGVPQGPGSVAAVALDPRETYLTPGKKRILRFTFEVTVPTGQEGEAVTLSFLDGLQGHAQPVINAVTHVTGGEFVAVRADSGLAFEECTLTVNPRAFKRGDANVDGTFDLTDPIMTLEVLFLGVGQFFCPDAADSNDDGEVDISDTINSLTFQFLGGSIPSPGPNDCGKDPTDDALNDCLYENC